MDLRTQIMHAYDALEAQRIQLEERLNSLNASLLKIPEGEGKWSVNQVLAHLSNSEFGTVRYINKKMLGLDGLEELNFLAKVRSKLLKWLLDSNIRFKMPKQLPEPTNELSYDELKSQFEKNRNSLKELIQSFPEEALNKMIFRHPFAGRFSLYQAVAFLEDHYNHHVHQIDRILKVVENRGVKETGE